MADNPDDAEGWANSAQGRGRQRVYRVEPLGDVHPDPEGYGHMAPRARIIEKVFENKPPEPKPGTTKLVDDMFNNINAQRKERGLPLL
jgi:hypothetical protein